MTRTTLPLIFGCLILGACSGTSILSGAKPPAPAGAAPAPPVVTLTDRAFQVGAVTARATKCGYNFDPVKVKTSYIAYETSLGATPEDLSKLEKVYTIAYNGIAKAAAGEANYCNDKKTKEIKADLARILAGDYTPPPKKVASAEDDGVFGGLFGGATNADSEGLNIKPSTANGF